MKETMLETLSGFADALEKNPDAEGMILPREDIHAWIETILLFRRWLTQATGLSEEDIKIGMRELYGGIDEPEPGVDGGQPCPRQL